ncbi:DUF4190 domain-containing protein [Streptomyces bluensis]|uniref:DUF4190 domain-containing protein n=1 Tax=Streptomyces bluensis TaxID=33897 RepID=A0ABW6UQE8_9ACTN
MSDEAHTPQTPDTPGRPGQDAWAPPENRSPAGPLPPEHAAPTSPAAPAPAPSPGSGFGSEPQDAVPAPGVRLDKPPAPAPDPWAPPADTVSSASTPPAPPSAYVRQTFTHGPPAGYPIPPASGIPAAPYPHPGPTPFAPPGQGEPVPPPPIGPDGPGQVPYGYPQYPSHPSHPGHPGHGHQYAPHQYAAYQGAPGYGWPGMPLGPSNGMGIASLTLGIIAAVGFCMWPLAILLGVLAVIFGVVGRAKAGRGEATNPGQALAGIICGATGIVLGVLAFVLIVVVSDDSAGAGGAPLDTGRSASPAAATSLGHATPACYVTPVG